VHPFLGVKKTSKINILPTLMHMGEQHHAHGSMMQQPRLSHLHGRMRQYPECDFWNFPSIFERCSVLKCLGTWDKISSTCVLFKNLVGLVNIHSSYPLTLHVCLVLPIYMIYHWKYSKHVWSCIKTIQNLPQTYTTHLNDLLFVFKY